MICGLAGHQRIVLHIIRVDPRVDDVTELFDATRVSGGLFYEVRSQLQLVQAFDDLATRIR